MPPEKIFDLKRGAPPHDQEILDCVVGDDPRVLGISETVRKSPQTLVYKGSDIEGSNFPGYGPLRVTLAKQHKVSPDQIITAAGGMNAITFVFKLLTLRRNESENPQEFITVATEQRTYDRFGHNLRIEGFKWEGVPLDANGKIDLETLEVLFQRKKIHLLYLIYEGQNPSGVSYTDEEIRAIKEVCGKHDALLLLDGAYHKLTYGWERSEIEDQDIEPNGILMRSFTKEVSAGLKCGYLVVPQNLVAEFTYIVSHRRLNPDYPTEAWYNEFITSPDNLYQSHINSVRAYIAPRLQALLDALPRYSPGAIYPHIKSGYFMGVRYEGVSSRGEFQRVLEGKGILVDDPGSFFSPKHRNDPEVEGYVRIPFAVHKPEDVEEICRRIAAAHQALRAA